MYEWIENEQVRARIADKMAELESINENSVEFERFVREQMVYPDLLDSDEYFAFTKDLQTHLIREKNFDKQLAALSFLTFEWPHRKVPDIDERMLIWQRVIRHWDARFKEYSICSYALSRYYYFANDTDKMLEFALDACQKAPEHVGFLNNYTEGLLEKSEAAILSSTDEQPPEFYDALRDALGRFEDIEVTTYYPIFYVSRGRLCACLGEYDRARQEFAAARGLATKMHDEKHPRMARESDFVTEMGKITDAQSTTTIMAASQEVKKSITKIGDEEAQRAEELTAKIDEVMDEMNGQRVEMLEFLGFFSGIISFVVASIQIGSDMDFTARALLILVMSGALLAVFGALGMMLDAHAGSGKSKSTAGRAVRAISAKSVGIIVVGLILIVVGLAANAMM